MLGVLRRIVQEVSVAPNLREALNILVSRVRAAMHADVCSVYLLDEHSDEHVLVATEGLSPDCVGTLRLGSGRGLIGLVVARAEPVNVDDSQKHSHFLLVPEVAEADFHAFLGVPIIFSRKVLGVLIVQAREIRRYDDDEVALLVTLSAQLAGLINRIDVTELLSAGRRSVERSIFLTGLDGVSGVAIGEAVALVSAANLDSVRDRVVEDPQAEAERFRVAVQQELDELARLRNEVKSTLSEADLALFDAYAMMLRGDSMQGEVIRHILEGNWAPGALRKAIAAHVHAFEAMEDPYLRERAADIRDIGKRLLQRLLQTPERDQEYPLQTILAGDELSVTDLAAVPADRLAGIVSTKGTGASHLAVLARGMAVPAVFGVDGLPTNRIHGQEVVVDGYSARVCIAPEPKLRAQYQRLAEEEQALSLDLEKLRDEQSLTLDGHHVPLLANAALFTDIAAARERGAEGIGLYRSEMHFALRERFPGEEEQVATYRRVIKAFSPRPVTIRTLDIGGDKGLDYFPIRETNPFLGYRGIRVSLDHPELFLTQLRAILRAGHNSRGFRVMLPMVSRVAELDETLELLDRARRELEVRDEPQGTPEIGIMVEVPSTVFQAEHYARRVDFLSIGTNDLTQYILGVDRGNSRVSHLFDGLHPAVLVAIRDTVAGARAHKCDVSVCGELAGDPAAALLLVGLGVDALSMSQGAINRVKWVIRSFKREHAQSLARDALDLERPEDVRAMMCRELEKAGLGGLVRPGR